MVDKVLYPVIGTEESFGTSCGNKLTKAWTVSYRGKANDRLAEYGNVFNVTPLKDSPGLFVLMGNAEVETGGIPDEIEIIEDMNNHEDLPTTDMDGDITFDPSFEELEDATLIDESSIKFE